MIVIVDYGMGNIGSLKNILKKIGHQAIISNDLRDIRNASKLILPGVGHFQEAMVNLQKLNLIETLNHKVLIEKTPILGICLGMQLMTSFSEEGNVHGLDWIKGNTTKFTFPNQPEIKIPHMGWNEIIPSKSHKINTDFEIPSRFYFVHSYFVSCEDKIDILHETDYHGIFTSAFNRENIYGVQYHPEKSHVFGLQLMKNFIELC
ncbi:MAG: imidazole glycerol phosphate synthase subunit HisH [Crocinitomicaceae bacterium]|jgi:glutamine amidotransferase